MFRSLLVAVAVLLSSFFLSSAAGAYGYEAPAFFPSESAARAYADAEGYYWYYAGAPALTVSGREYGGVLVERWCGGSEQWCRKPLYWPRLSWTCPTGTQIDQATGDCVAPPPTPEEKAAACAAKSGQPGPILRGNFDGFENDSYSDADGCDVVPVGEVTCAIPYSEANAQRDYFPPVCAIPSEYTGTYSETGEQSPTQLTAPPPPQATTDSRETTESSVTDPATVTTNPDGSSTTTQKTTKTKVSEAGSTVSAPSPSKSVVVSQEGGKVIVEVTEVARTTHPDGKVVTTTTVTKTVTSTPTTTTTVNAPAGQKPIVTVHTTPEATDSGGTKTTVTAYPDGRTETSTETTGGGGQGADGVSETPGEGEGDEPLPDGGAAAGDVGFPTLAEAPGFGESLTALSQGIAASPIAQAASSLSGLSDGSGSCNAPSFTLFGQTFSFDFHCQVWPELAPVIEAAALAAWAILAVLILMSA